MNNLSVIVPIADRDEAWHDLIQDLKFLSKRDEIIFVCCDQSFKLNPSDLTKRYKIKCKIQWIIGEKGRAKQMNLGAHKAINKILWFLHCDSRVTRKAFLRLKKSTLRDAVPVYFFDLKFERESSPLMVLNTLGVKLRSNIFKMPFGDQGFCMAKNLFEKLGGYDEDAKYGEDHLLIWKAHQNGISVKPIGDSITTSSRKYRINGWLNTTQKHLFLTYKQAIPELIKTIKQRWIR